MSRWRAFTSIAALGLSALVLLLTDATVALQSVLLGWSGEHVLAST